MGRHRSEQVAGEIIAPCPLPFESLLLPRSRSWPRFLRPPTRRIYPTRAVTIITPFAAGSVTDATARAIAAYLQETLGQTFIVENRAGAGGMPAASAVAKAAPDGHTLLITTNSTHSAAPGLFKSVPYDPIKDFTPVARIGSFPSLIAANPNLPIKSMQELVAYRQGQSRQALLCARQQHRPHHRRGA